MSISQDKLEEERIARQAAIKKAIAPDKVEEQLNWAPEAEGTTKAEPPVRYSQPYVGRPLHPWEVLVKGRPVQFRPMTAREAEAMDEKTLMENQKRQDEAHERKVQAAIRERDAEQKDMDKRREYENKTGKREYGKERFISLEEARRRGLIGNGSDDDGGNNWSSPGNPDGIMCGGR